MATGSTESSDQDHQAREDPFTTRYWLRHCEGFRVVLEGECIGYIEGVEPNDELSLPTTLVVRQHSGTTTRVPVEAVTVVIPHAEQAILSPSLTGELVDELHRKVRSTAERSSADAATPA
jgi:hypothetical protein